MNSRVPKVPANECRGHNLWNLAGGKNRCTIAYIRGLIYPPTIKQQMFFSRIIRQALQKNTANGMLEHIGYVNNVKKPRVYQWASDAET